MIRLINSVFLIFTFSAIVTAQQNDVFNLDNSRKFATYLFDSGQYDLAADEFERVVFMQPSDSLSILKLIRSYRFEKKYNIGVKRAFDLMSNREMLNMDFLTELFLLQARAGKHQDNFNLVQSNQVLNDIDRNNLLLSALMLDKDWDSASDYINENQQQNEYYQQLGSLMLAKVDLKKKNPFLSAGLSTIVPGLGKVYAGDWQDGLIAFAFVASNAWQAYRGFNEDGIKSTYGWIFGSIGAGFYLGNIYGSFKSAKDYNKRVEKAYYDQVSGVIYSNL